MAPLAGVARAGSDRPRCFAYDGSFRFAVGLAPVPPRRLDPPAGADGVVTLDAFARTDGLAARLGGELTLCWIGGCGGGVFLPVPAVMPAR